MTEYWKANLLVGAWVVAAVVAAMPFMWVIGRLLDVVGLLLGPIDPATGQPW